MEGVGVVAVMCDERPRRLDYDNQVDRAHAKWEASRAGDEGET